MHMRSDAVVGEGSGARSTGRYRGLAEGEPPGGALGVVLNNISERRRPARLLIDLEVSMVSEAEPRPVTPSPVPESPLRFLQLKAHLTKYFFFFNAFTFAVQH